MIFGTQVSFIINYFKLFHLTLKLNQAVLLFYLVGRILAFRKLLDEASLGKIAH